MNTADRCAIYQEIANASNADAPVRVRIVNAIADSQKKISGAAFWSDDRYNIDLVRNDMNIFAEASVFSHEMAHILSGHISSKPAGEHTTVEAILREVESVLEQLRGVLSDEEFCLFLAEKQIEHDTCEHAAWDAAGNLMRTWLTEQESLHLMLLEHQRKLIELD